MYCAVLFSALKIMKKIDGPVKYGMVLEGITLVNTYQNIYVVKTKYCYKLWNDRVLQGLEILYVSIVYDLQKQNISQISRIKLMYGLIFLSMDTFIYRNNDERKLYEKR